ncbi:hypothetical protein RHMOL_Rhmol11G0218900 [Rhododendron molle]|uniref:Uncharacterized protein n=1 Tax=Rhododendron molle TaxID=49168 RepID=A0ACC0LV02_RHOML|nr:hypothetical protein RHMOL_Rhmol11G0218900 [Rhododendron molle]
MLYTIVLYYDYIQHDKLIAYFPVLGRGSSKFEATATALTGEAQVYGAEGIDQANGSSQVSHGLFGSEFQAPTNLQLSQPQSQEKAPPEKAVTLGLTTVEGCQPPQYCPTATDIRLLTIQTAELQHKYQAQ